MIVYRKKLYIIFISFILLNTILSLNVNGCKDIVVVGDATDGDYNLLLKVRDPSRPGPQVLCIIPEGYEYTYNHPWTGKPMKFKTKHKYIGVATKGDTIPNIVKAGMILTDSGIGFGDADTGSNWKNPTRNAWDDFDWIRYSCEKADDEDQAVKLLTEECVDRLHATGVSENLFIVGPKKGYVIEADAFHYKIKEIDDIVVMSNYPKDLWKTQRYKKAPIASSFDIEKEKYVRKFETIRLNSLYGVKIVNIGEDWIVARQIIPFLSFYNNKISVMGYNVKIQLGERKTVGDYSVELLDINSKKAKVLVNYVYKAWEEKMLQYIEPKIGQITIKDMINWSRLHGEDLDGLRPMCEDIYQYESVIIYKIPEENYNQLSIGWYSSNHPCSAIYIPTHISNSDIFKSYKTEKAAELSLELLDIFGHGVLSPYYSKIEDVFLWETGEHEKISNKLLENGSDISEFLTILDISMQEQALLTEQIWLDIGKKFSRNSEIIEIIGNIWRNNYSISLDLMESAIYSLKNISKLTIISKIIDIGLNIFNSRIKAINAVDKDTSTLDIKYEKCKKAFKQGEYALGFKIIKNGFLTSNLILHGKVSTENIDQKENRINVNLSGVGIFIIFIFTALAIFIIFRKNKK